MYSALPTDTNTPLMATQVTQQYKTHTHTITLYSAAPIAAPTDINTPLTEAAPKPLTNANNTIPPTDNRTAMNYKKINNKI